MFNGVTVFCTAVGGSDEWPEEENTMGTPYNLDYPMIPMNTPTFISANEGETLNYAMVVPELANDVTCYIYYAGESGEDDADLYMNFDEEIDLVNREANFVSFESIAQSLLVVSAVIVAGHLTLCLSCF